MPLCVFSQPHLKHDCGLRYGAYKPRPPDLTPPGTPPLQCVTILQAVHLISHFFTQYKYRAILYSAILEPLQPPWHSEPLLCETLPTATLCMFLLQVVRKSCCGIAVSI